MKESERLTHYRATLNGGEYGELNDGFDSFDACNVLTAYEDTGLSPEEVEDLKQRLAAMTEDCLKWHERAQDAAQRLLKQLIDKDDEIIELRARLKELESAQ